MPRLTKKFIENDIQPPERGQVIYRDDLLRGFGLRVTAGSMSFIVECRINSKVRRMTICRYNQMTLNQARQEARKLLENATIGSGPGRPRSVVPTLSQVLDGYVSNKLLRPGTVISYKQVIGLHLGGWLSKSVTAITKEMVLTRHRDLVNKLSPTTANLVMVVLRALLYFAGENYQSLDGRPLILDNPVSKLSKNQAWFRKKRRQGVIPDHKLADWYRAMMSLSSKNGSDFLLLLLLTGLRRNEAATLRWSDIDFEARILRVRAEIAKNHREHLLPLSEFLLLLLSRRKQQCIQSEFVFPGRYGGHMVSCLRVIARIAQMSQCKFTLHDLRRSFVSMAAKLSIQHYLTKRLLNHIGQKDDTDEYIVISTEHLREPMERITCRFLELMGCQLDDSG